MPPELIDESAGGIDAAKKEACALEVLHASDIFFVKASRLGPNTHFTLARFHPYRMAHTVEFIKHELSKDVDIGFA